MNDRAMRIDVDRIAGVEMLCDRCGQTSDSGEWYYAANTRGCTSNSCSEPARMCPQCGCTMPHTWYDGVTGAARKVRTGLQPLPLWLVFHEHIEHMEFVSAHLTEAGAEAVVIEHEDRWIGNDGLEGGKVVMQVVAT